MSLALAAPKPPCDLMYSMRSTVCICVHVYRTLPIYRAINVSYWFVLFGCNPHCRFMGATGTVLVLYCISTHQRLTYQRCVNTHIYV